MNSDESSFRCAPTPKVSISDADSKVLCPLHVPFQLSASIHLGKNFTLGKGTYGVVRTGTVVVNNRIDKNDNAFKTFLGKDGVAFSQTVLREIIPLCCLPPHDNVLQPRLVYADDKNRIHFSCEKMNCNLYERLKTTASTIDQKLMWSLQLIRAVNHMHSNGFLHRDIKLENVFLDERDNVVLGDLGMSRYTSPFVESRFSSGVCTLWTRAPELCAYAVDVRKSSRELSYDASVDCWSLAITILSIFASRYFFQGKDEEDMLKLIFTTLGKPNDKTTSEAWCFGRETRNWKLRWKIVAQGSTLLSENTEDVVDSLILECSRRRIIAHPDLLRSLVPLLALEPEKRGSANEVLETPFWKRVEQENNNYPISKIKTKQFLPIEMEKKIVQGETVSEEKLIFVSLKYYGIDIPEPKCLIPKPEKDQETNQIYESCTTRGILRLAVTEWILSLQKSLSLLPLTIIDSIFFWERVRDLVDVQVKNEMVLAAACCSLVSKIHEYAQYPSQRWIRCISNTATVDELVKYEMLALKTSNCGVFTSISKHPVHLLSEMKLNMSQVDRDKILLSLSSLMAKHHTQDFGIEKLVSDSLLVHNENI